MLVITVNTLAMRARCIWLKDFCHLAHSNSIYITLYIFSFGKDGNIFLLYDSECKMSEGRGGVAGVLK